MGEGGEGGTGGGTGGTAGKATMIDPDDFDGQQVFRYDTFGDEQFWTDTLRLHEAIQAALDPMTALSLGLKVDADGAARRYPRHGGPRRSGDDRRADRARCGRRREGHAWTAGNLTSVGITCALCHSDVDDSVMEGIGMRIDGAANRDLDPGAIIALSRASPA